MKNFTDEWDNSYMKKDNFLFFPDDNIVRFISKYIKKRVGFDEFINSREFESVPKVLDFGCGVGRHVKLINDFKLDAYGFDLSKEAIKTAKNICMQLGLEKLPSKIIVADITELPYKNEYFDFMLSHGVLDSTPFAIAKRGMTELHRCLNSEGKIYFDLISDTDSSFNGKTLECIVKGNHETDTVQSYFNESRIDELLQGLFSINEMQLSTKVDLLSNQKHSRWLLVVEKN